MPDKPDVTTALYEWTGLFMRHSWHELRQYSREHGLSMTQISALFQLHHHGVCRVSEIGDNLGVTIAAASQMLDRLVNLGLVERSEDPEDRRGKQLVLTEAGRQVLQQTIQARHRWLETLAGLLNPEEQKQVSAALQIMIDRTRQYDAEIDPRK